MRTCTPRGVWSRRQKMVARTKPVTETVARRIQKSSGVRLMFFHDRRTSTRISAHHGFANVHTVSAFVLCCDTRFSIFDFADCGFVLRPAPALAVAAPPWDSSAMASRSFAFASHSRQYSTRFLIPSCHATISYRYLLRNSEY